MIVVFADIYIENFPVIKIERLQNFLFEHADERKWWDYAL